MVVYLGAWGSFYFVPTGAFSVGSMFSVDLSQIVNLFWNCVANGLIEIKISRKELENKVPLKIWTKTIWAKTKDKQNLVK